MVSKVFGSITGVFVAAAVATGAFATTAEARQKVNISQYCAAQNAPGANMGQVHRDYDPYVDSEVTVTLNSRHGSITMLFNCRAVIPVCTSQRPYFALTEGALSLVHAGLGGYNAGDAAPVRESMARLAQSYKIVEPNNADAMGNAKHLNNVHGMPVVSVGSSGRLRIEENGKTVIYACYGQLKR